VVRLAAGARDGKTIFVVPRGRDSAHKKNYYYCLKENISDKS